MNWPYLHFTQEEMACHCGCGGLPRPEFMERLELLRVNFGKLMPINSAFRCPKHNAEVSHTGLHGEHTLGLCADVGILNPDAMELVHIAILLGFRRIGVSQKSGSARSSRYVHLGIATLAEGFPDAIWSY